MYVKTARCNFCTNLTNKYHKIEMVPGYEKTDIILCCDDYNKYFHVYAKIIKIIVNSTELFTKCK